MCGIIIELVSLHCHSVRIRRPSMSSIAAENIEIEETARFGF